MGHGHPKLIKENKAFNCFLKFNNCLALPAFNPYSNLGNDIMKKPKLENPIVKIFYEDLVLYKFNWEIYKIDENKVEFVGNRNDFINS